MERDPLDDTWETQSLNRFLVPKTLLDHRGLVTEQMVLRTSLTIYSRLALYDDHEAANPTAANSRESREIG